jgi:sulfite reductase alpha subunit-like flavoprotein
VSDTLTGYINYNVVAKKLDRRLLALGGVPLIERGLGDDQHPQGYEAALDPWLQQLWSTVRSIFPLPAGLTEVAAVSQVSMLFLH